ncbi:MAG: TlpA family protein disulfide reductase [Acidobacteriota bacterium]|nr:MAG: TlpA family protein disulfide reductase [Acidobacteriota bacterium]
MTRRTSIRSFFVLTAFFSISLLIGCSGGDSGNGTAGTNGAKGDDSAFPPLPPTLANTQYQLLDGTPFKLSDKKGKVLLVNIWGTWCGPCRAEMPHLIALQNKYGPQGFEVIGLNIGDGSGSPEPVDLIKSFAEKMGLNYTLAISSNENTREFYRLTRQEVVPQTIIVDRNGKLRGVLVGSGQRVYDSMYETVGKVMAE